MVTEPVTVKDWLTDLAKTDTSSELDSLKMQALLRKVGFPQAVVTVGVVYTEGHGMPVSIHAMAGAILKAS